MPLLRTQPASRVSGPGFKIGVAGGVDVPPNLKGGGQGKLPAGGGGGHRAVERRWREPWSRAVEDDRWEVEAVGERWPARLVAAVATGGGGGGGIRRSRGWKRPRGRRLGKG